MIVDSKGAIVKGEFTTEKGTFKLISIGKDFDEWKNVNTKEIFKITRKQLIKRFCK